MARGRADAIVEMRAIVRTPAKTLFGFDYVWEVLKPEHQRKFGYYTLPILWGDRLVAGKLEAKAIRAPLVRRRCKTHLMRH